ncbi:MAG: FAD-dependent oxidoreductase [Actinomycetota bacterium]|nr:FAD-dependent oxidoreductase [Actinomycetota bacterium]
MANVVVVGGGFAGLSAAARLAKLRHSVTLVESTDILGGQLRGVTRDGLVWQTHRETVTLPGVFRDLFRKSGRPLERALELEKIVGRRHVYKDKLVLDLPLGNRGDQAEALIDTFGFDKWSTWVDRFTPVWDSIRRVTLDRTFTGKSDFDVAQWKAIRARRSLYKVAAKELDDYYLRKIVLDPVRLAGHQRRSTPGFVAVSTYVERNFGLWRFAGGRPALADALTTRLEERKVDVLTGTAAHGIRFGDGEATGVETSGGVIPADVVIWCAPNHPTPLPRSPELRLIPASRTYLTLDPAAPDLADEILVHSNPPIRMWTSAPGQWTIEHRSGEDPVVVMARCGIDIRPYVVSRWDQTPSQLVTQCHWGWEWQLWTTAVRIPGVNPVGGVFFAGAHAHPGGSLEMIGMATAAIAEAVGPAPR